MSNKLPKPTDRYHDREFYFRTLAAGGVYASIDTKRIKDLDAAGKLIKKKEPEIPIKKGRKKSIKAK